MTFRTVLAISFGEMIRCGVILAEMTTEACRCRIPVDAVSVAVLTFCRPVPPDQWVARLTVIKLSGVPCLFTVALSAVLAAELVEVWICMTLAAIPAGPLILSLSRVTARTNDIIMNSP